MAGPSRALGHVRLAVLALEARIASTGIILDQVGAVAVVHAWTAGAVVDVHLTVWSREAGVSAVAVEAIDAVVALPTIETWRRGALIHILLAQDSGEARLTPTLKPAHFVEAGGVVEARLRGALIHVYFTVLPGIAQWAEALVVGHQVAARTTIATGMHEALVVLLVAQGPRVARPAPALERSHCVLTDATEARATTALRTFVHVMLAQQAPETRQTQASSITDAIYASTTMKARTGRALVDLSVAGVTFVAMWTAAPVTGWKVEAHLTRGASHSQAVVLINFTLVPSKTHGARTRKVSVRWCRPAGGAIVARGVIASVVRRGARHPAEFIQTVTVKAAGPVLASATIDARV